MTVWINQFVSDFADQALVLPIAIAVFVTLHVTGWRRGAIVWGAVTVATLCLMLVLKLSFGACGYLLLDGEIRSPSGHTASAGLIYGSLLGLFVERIFRQRTLSVLVVLAVVGIVGATRVMLGAHTTAEAALGALVGLGAAMLIIEYMGEPTKRGKFAFALLPTIALVFLLHGLHLPAEAAVHSFRYEFWPLSLCRVYT